MNTSRVHNRSWTVAESDREGEREARPSSANTQRIFGGLCERAEREGWRFRDLLAALLAADEACRQQERIERAVRRARLPEIKTIDGFDFDAARALRPEMLAPFLASEFAFKGPDVVLSGGPGCGKTHLAIAIAYRALQNGFTALFTTARELAFEVVREIESGHPAELFSSYVTPEVLVLDALDGVGTDPRVGSFLRRVVNERRAQRRAVIVTITPCVSGPGSDHADVHEDDESLPDSLVARLLGRGRLVRLDEPARSSGFFPRPVRAPDAHGLSATFRPSVRWRGIAIDLSQERVTIDDAPLSLRRLEYKLLAALVSEPGKLFTRADLVRMIWGDDASVQSRTVDTHVRRLRSRLGAYRDAVETLHGVGYRWRDGAGVSLAAPANEYAPARAQGAR